MGEIYVVVDHVDGGEYNPLDFNYMATAAVYGFKFAKETGKAEHYSKKWKKLINTKSGPFAR